MDAFLIRGGRPLQGSVRIGGAKNAALPAMAAALLTDQPLVLDNIPRLGDVATIRKLLAHLGVEASGPEAGQVHLRAARIARHEAPYDLVRTMRAAVLVLGPLVARCGRARISLPGGCAIGPRPINLHLDGLARLGAEITLQGGYVEAKAGRLRGARISFETPTVTGTENLMMAATLAEGTTVLENAAAEPEVADLAGLLTGMGAGVEGAGTQTIAVHGVAALGGARHRVIPDRIEAGTLAVAAAITRGAVELVDCEPAHLEAVSAKLAEAGAQLTAGPGRLRVAAAARPRAANVRTGPYPAFATDMQAQVMALLCLAEGRSVITETVFENRFMHVNELLRMGADITVAGGTACVAGVERLSGAPLTASDLRASASLVLAGLAAEGTTLVRRIYHLDRGYERLEAKLGGLGADVERVQG
jgi:UDP-N-acetylglucosamine 1-carboxyvinyltransferase